MNRWKFLNGAVLAFVLSISHQAAAEPTKGSFENSGLVLNYEISGRGSPVVVLAGGPGFGASYMQPVVDMVAGDHTVILLEQRGTGRSLPAEQTIATVNEPLVVSDLEALRRTLGYSRWTILGHSFGTLTAMKYAIAYPDHVRSMVLLAVMPPRSADDRMDANLQKRLSVSTEQEFQKLLAKMKRSSNDVERSELAGQMNGLLLPAYLYDQSKVPELMALAGTAGMNARTAQLITQSVGRYDLVSDLSKLSVPVLIIQGSADPLDPTMAAKTQTAIPGAKLTLLDNCGHFAWLEAPGKLSAQLKMFLSDK